MASLVINIELNTRRLFLKKGGQIINTFPVAIGKPTTPTPTGQFSILSKILNPGGALGTRWMQFTSRNHGIHGTNQPWLIGQAVSLGCVRMHNSNVEKVYSQVSIGTPVIIKHSFSTNINNPYRIYIVKKGDTLWSIAQKMSVSITSLKQINNLNSNLIYPGQRLIIPD